MYFQLIRIKKTSFYITCNSSNYFMWKNHKRKTFKLYVFRMFVFFKLVHFIQRKKLNLKRFLSIVFTYYSFFWYFFIKFKDIRVYLTMVRFSFRKYKSVYYPRRYYRKPFYGKVFFRNYTVLPSSYLNFFKIEKSSIKKINEKKITELYLFLKNTYRWKDYRLDQPKYQSILKFKKNDYGYSKMKLNFLRVQRRYNKRRYSKVRSVSRTSFFAGISLSSILLGLLWGGSIKNVDWLTSWIVVININSFIFILFSYFIFRIWSLNNLNIFIRKKNKIRVVNSLHKMFMFKFFVDKK